MAADQAALDRVRQQLRQIVGDSGFHEAAATAANFNQMDRIADSTGIPLDAGPRSAMTELGREIGSDRFASAKNTLQRL